MRRKIPLVLELLAALMLPSETFAKHGGGCIVVMVGQAMPITDLLMARVMVALATVMLITDIMAGGITVTGTPAMVAGGVAAGTLMVLERAGASGQQ